MRPIISAKMHLVRVRVRVRVRVGVRVGVRVRAATHQEQGHARHCGRLVRVMVTVTVRARARVSAKARVRARRPLRQRGNERGSGVVTVVC